jgi:hypothetical protein
MNRRAPHVYWPLLLLVMATVIPLRAADSVPWYQSLRPGVTRTEIARVAGGPLVPRGDVEICRVPPGEIAFTFRGDVLQRADYRDAPPEAITGLYSTHGTTSAAAVEERRKYLRAGSFAIVPPFASSPVRSAAGGPVIRTSKYQGAGCYEADGQYLIIEPMLWVGVGEFADKAARVLLISADGKEKTLYRADEHWRELRPARLSSAAAAKRESTLRQLGEAVVGRQASEVLGPEDSQMGSGIDYRTYYLPRGLAIVQVGSDGPGRAGRIMSIRFSSPGGSGRWLSLQEWLARDARRP